MRTGHIELSVLGSDMDSKGLSERCVLWRNEYHHVVEIRSAIIINECETAQPVHRNMDDDR